MSFAPKICPHKNCPSQPNGRSFFRKKGFFKIKRLNQYIRKFQCKSCQKYCSSRTFKLDYKHKKMDLNYQLAQLLIEGNSLRSCSRILGLTYKNTYNKFLWLRKVTEVHKSKLKFYAQKIQFDELETIHHTKCKPLSIALVVSENHQLLAAQVAEMPAKGRLAEFSRRKYGPRKDERIIKIKEALQFAKQRTSGNINIIESDSKPGYSNLVKEVFGEVLKYEQYLSKDKRKMQDRLHELKQKKRFDPLFAVNHQCARLRSQIKRLTRRSWCTTKKPENLQLHLDLFIHMQTVNKF